MNHPGRALVERTNEWPRPARFELRARGARSCRFDLVFGNDLGYPGSLIAVTTKMNGTGEKGSKDPSEWLPPENTCKLSQNYVAVKYRWGLALDNAELQVLTDQLAGHCGDQLIEVELVPN